MKYSFAKTLQTFLIMSRQEKSLKSDQIHICLNIFIFFLSIYLITLSGNVVSDVGVARIDVLSSLVENFDLNIFPHQGTDGVTGADGRLYSWFGIGSVLLSLPLYLLARLFAGDPFSVVSTMNPIIGAGTNVLVFLFSRAIGYQKRTSLIVALIYGLSTIAFYYAKDTGDHAIETFFLLLSFYFMYLHTIEGKISNILFSAFSLGFCFLTRPNSLIAIPALLVLLFFERITTSSKNTDVSLPVRETSFFLLDSPRLLSCIWGITITVLALSLKPDTPSLRHASALTFLEGPVCLLDCTVSYSAQAKVSFITHHQRF